MEEVRTANGIVWSCSKKRLRIRCKPLMETQLIGLLKQCIHTKSLYNGQCLHSCILKLGFVRHGTLLVNHLLETYANCGDLRHARQLFDEMPSPDRFSWNRMIAGYVFHGQIEQARQLFEKLPDHGHHQVSWNSMISGYSRQKQVNSALNLFSEMCDKGVKANEYTFTTVVSACASCRREIEGRILHGQILRSGFERNIFVGSALVDLYSKCDRIEDAFRVFEGFSAEADEVVWSAMIAGFCRHRHDREAMTLFMKMLRLGRIPGECIFTTVLNLCSVFSGKELCSSLHALVLKVGLISNVFVGNSLLDCYGKSGSDVKDARKVFNEMPSHDEVSWNALIGAYVGNGDCVMALNLFCQMMQSGVRADHYTFASGLSACAGLATLDYGKQIIASVIKMGFVSDIFVGSVVVGMYGKCGEVGDAWKAFEFMDFKEKDTVAWTAMIGAYAQNGFASEAIKLFEMMLKTSSCQPNNVTFLELLSACRHAGLVDEGYRYFKAMIQKHGISPDVDHYGCMVDLLARSGRMHEAEALVKTMPFKPSKILWGALHGACKIHGNFDLGKVAAEELNRGGV